MSIFGIDVDQIVGSAFSGNLSPVTLTRVGVQEGEYNPVTDRYEDEDGNPVGPPEDQIFTTDGIVPGYSTTAGRAEMLSTGMITEKEVPILLIATPLGTKPEIGDKITIGSETYTMTGIIEKDPANATWTVKGEL